MWDFLENLDQVKVKMIFFHIVLTNTCITHERLIIFDYRRFYQFKVISGDFSVKR
jgi:hypothetical protein